MKQWLIRALLVALVICMILSVTACKPGDDPSKYPGGIAPLEGEEPVDLQGYTFTVADYSSGRWNKEISGTPYADAWIQLMDEVETLYNCKLEATYLSPGETFNTIQPEIAAGGKYADIVIATQWEYGKFLGADLMLDLNKLDVDWDNPWWNQRIREMCSFGGKTNLAGGSFIFDTSGTWLLYYNEAIWKECGFEDPYKLVDEGRWTMDVFADYCRRACIDRDNSGELDSEDDRYGLIAPDGDFCRAWFLALGGHHFETNPDNGRVRLACNNQRTFDLVERMRRMVREDKSVTGSSYRNDVAGMVNFFVHGGSLFFSYMPGVSGLKDMEDDWGVMPLPKLDTDQKEYLSGVDHNACVFGVTNTNKDLREVSIILEALGRHAMILEKIYWPDYKETYWRHEETDTRMVSQYVVGHGQHDLALIMENTDGAFKASMNKVFNIVYGGGSADFASWVDAVEDTVNRQIEDYFGY